MYSEQLKDRIIKSMSAEYQSVWLVDANDMSMQIFASNMDESIPGSIATAIELNSYNKARDWYVEYNVMEQDKDKVHRLSDIDNIRLQLTDNNSFFIEYNRISDGVINYNQLCYSGIFSDDGILEYILLGFRNIDIRKSMEVDDLTGICTRAAFFQKAEQLMRDNPDIQFDLMMSDIVDFKDVNETYGPKTGDEILKWLGAFFLSNLHDKMLIGRYGGDQFVMLTTHESMAYVNSERANLNFDEALGNSGLPHIVIKFGIYEDIQPGISIIHACDMAHTALNSIKHHYEKRLAYYDDVLKNELEKQRKIENSMYQALKEDQFKVYYQPKHDTKTGKLIGAEALIRWIHPEYGFMSPADFIPLFEKNGFIVESDFYVWKRTCENLSRWHKKGLKTVPISVNASKLTFDKQGILMTLQKAVSDNDVSPAELHVEITETIMTSDIDALIRKLNALRAIGYQIELDDFGSGYSSINILGSLPIDVVKLDMSFMRQFGDEKRIKVLAACIKLAKDLGYKTISEGVETKEQCEMLNILGADAIQGYYYSKPLSEDEFEKYMSNY